MDRSAARGYGRHARMYWGYRVVNRDAYPPDPPPARPEGAKKKRKRPKGSNDLNTGGSGGASGNGDER